MNLVKKVLKSRPAIAFAASFLVTMLIFAAFGYAPFGLKSVAGADANIQYLDLFAYSFHSSSWSTATGPATLISASLT